MHIAIEQLKKIEELSSNWGLNLDQEKDLVEFSADMLSKHGEAQ